MTAIGKTVRLYLAEGTSSGLLTAEIMNWTGRVVAAPRTSLSTLMLRSEVRRTGVYFLLGADDDGNPLAYVGEGDDISRRLYSHQRDKKKDWFDRVVAVTNKDDNVTKAHARYLEARLIELATAAGRVSMTNRTDPDATTFALSEPDVSDMEFFIEQLSLVLPVLGVNLLRPTQGPPITPVPTPGDGTSAAPETASGASSPSIGSTPKFTITTRDGSVTASMRVVDGEFVVEAGSLARPAWTGDDTSTYKRLRQHVESTGALVDAGDGKHMIFTRDYPFGAISAAASVLYGRNSNGRTAFRVPNTKTSYADWETSRVAAAAEASGVDDDED